MWQIGTKHYRPDEEHTHHAGAGLDRLTLCRELCLTASVESGGDKYRSRSRLVATIIRWSLRERPGTLAS